MHLSLRERMGSDDPVLVGDPSRTSSKPLGCSGVLVAGFCHRELVVTKIIKDITNPPSGTFL